MFVKIEEFSPGLASLLPLFYIGWSDSVLSPSEMKLIHKKILELDFLQKNEKEYLIKYTDPSIPPDESTFKLWLDVMKYYSNLSDWTKKESLSQLGLEIAHAALAYKPEKLWNAPSVSKALDDLAVALGIDTPHSLQTVIRAISPDNKISLTAHNATFDPHNMRLILDGRRHEMKRQVRNLLRDPIFTTTFSTDKEILRANVLMQMQHLADQGYGQKAYGSLNDDAKSIGDYMAIFETLACHDGSLTVKFGVQFGLFGGAIYSLGSQEQIDKYIPDIAKGKLLGCFAMTESSHGSNVKGLQTTATYDRNTHELIIHTSTPADSKEYIGNALHGKLAVVFAKLLVADINHGVHAVLVPYRSEDGQTLPGITVKDNGYKMGLNGVDNGKIWFEKVRVPVENLLSKYGNIDANGSYLSTITNPNKRFFTMLGALVGGRICVGLGALASARTALSIAIKFALNRRQFDGPTENEELIIMDYPTHQRRLVPLLVGNIVYQQALLRLADDYLDNINGDVRKIEIKAAGLKAMATWLANATIQECREACGGKGYLAENQLASLKADTDIFTTFEGDNHVLLQLVAKGLLTEYKESFHDEGVRGVLQYLFKKVEIKMSEFNYFGQRDDNTEHISSDDFHAEALRYREKKILITLADRMRKLLQRKVSAFDAFLQCQNHMIDLAKAYVERLAYREFTKTIEALPDSKEKSALIEIRKLYALETIHKDKGFYLESGYMNGEKSKAIRRVIMKSYQRVRPDLMTWIDSFGIPPESLKAPIALH